MVIWRQITVTFWKTSAELYIRHLPSVWTLLRVFANTVWIVLRCVTSWEYWYGRTWCLPAPCTQLQMSFWRTLRWRSHRLFCVYNTTPASRSGPATTRTKRLLPRTGKWALCLVIVNKLCCFLSFFTALRSQKVWASHICLYFLKTFNFFYVCYMILQIWKWGEKCYNQHIFRMVLSLLAQGTNLTLYFDSTERMPNRVSEGSMWKRLKDVVKSTVITNNIDILGHPVNILGKWCHTPFFDVRRASKSAGNSQCQK